MTFTFYCPNIHLRLNANLGYKSLLNLIEINIESVMFVTAPNAESFLESLRWEVEAIIASGQNNLAEELSALTKQKFASDRFPEYFRGNLAAQTVFITLNFQENNYKNGVRFDSFGSYLDAYQELQDSEDFRKNCSPLALKRLLFLEPFAEDKERKTKLPRLYLSLIPHTAIKSFSLSGFTPEILQPYLNRTLNIITEFPRKYILFCGSAFEQILRPYIVEKHHLDILSDRNSSSINLKFSLLDLIYEKQKFKVGLAHSFASLSMSAIDYSRYCKQLYDAA